MQIGEAAKRCGVGVETIRFYEREGLLPEPKRKNSGYRIYGEGELHRLRFIRHAKDLGFSLGEIRQVLSERRTGQCPCGTVIKLAEGHLAEVDAQIARLTAFRAELIRSLSEWKERGQQTASAGTICDLIERTMIEATASTKGLGSTRGTRVQNHLSRKERKV